MITEPTAVATVKRVSLIESMAFEYNMEPAPFLDAIKQTVMPGSASNAQIAAFLQVAHEYKLNPFLREIYAFPTKGGGIQPVVGVDGWLDKITNHPNFRGMGKPSFEEKNGKLYSCTIVAHREGWQEPIDVTEYFDECYRNTDPWNKMPKRMMRHKALKEAARYTFGFAGICDEDEARDAINITGISTELERSTDTKKEALKEKIGAKKAAERAPEVIPAPAAAPPPVEKPKTITVAPEEPKTEEQPPHPAEETPVAPPAPPTPISADQRQRFIDAVVARAASLEIDGQGAKTQARKILAQFGYSKTLEIMSDKLDALMQSAQSWVV